MPFKEITFNQIVFNPEVQEYCNNPKFKCPNYGHSHACPPIAPYLEDIVVKFKTYYLIFFKFDLEQYVKHKKVKNPNKSKEKIINSFYRKSLMRDYLEQEILEFIDNFQEEYEERLILWDGFCRLCYKENRTCTYDDNEPCRYPNDIRYSMEAVGINVDKTVKNLNINLEWPPIRYAYRFGLVCFK